MGEFMFCHDSKVIFYVLAGDRVFCNSIAAVLAGYAQAERRGETGTMAGAAGRSPFAADTSVVGLAEMLLDDGGEQRSLAPLSLDDSVVSVGLLASALKVQAPTLLLAVSLWADFCDEVGGHMDDGSEQEDAFAMAGLVPLARAA